MTVRILSCAEEEFSQAVSYYNQQCPGLGFEFAAEVKAALARIADFPDAWPRFSPRSRRCLLDRFPYGILYHQSAEGILWSGPNVGLTRRYGGDYGWIL